VEHERGSTGSLERLGSGYDDGPSRFETMDFNDAALVLIRDHHEIHPVPNGEVSDSPPPVTKNVRPGDPPRLAVEFEAGPMARILAIGHTPK
jgi:hypothetical protein